MSAIRAIAILGCAGAVLLLVAAGGQGQYYNPLRYDLRMAGPQYPLIPPPNPDPYAFGKYQPGNLSLTGNLRFGRSFQGPTPYAQSGSQLTTPLPSLKLSNFRRDSFGAEDIGTGAGYGAPTPYFPQGARVTNPQTARQPQFDRDPRTGLLRPSYLPPPPAPNVAPGQAGETPPLGLTGTPRPGVPPINASLFNTQGLTVSRRTYEWINALIESGREAEQARARTPGGLPQAGAEEAVPGRPGLVPAQAPGRPAPAIGYQPPVPSNVLNPNPPPNVVPAPRERRPIPGTAAPGVVPSAPAGPDAGKTAPAAKQQPKAPELGIPAPPEGEQPATGGLLVPPLPHVGTKTYGEYFSLAEAAMKERRYDYAEGMYAAAAALDGSKPEALFGRAGAMLATGRHVEVGHILTRAFKDHPDWAKGVPNLKTVYPDGDQWERVLGDVKADLEKSPDNAGLHFVAGYVLYAVGQPAAAVPYLEKAAALRGARGPEQVLLDAMKAAQAK